MFMGLLISIVNASNQTECISLSNQKCMTQPTLINPASTQRPKDIPLWSYFGRDVPDHNSTKIPHFRFLNYFAAAMYGMRLAPRNIKKFR